MNTIIELRQFLGDFEGHHFKGTKDNKVVWGDSFEEVLRLLL